MRKKRSVQMCISEILVNHKIGCELQSISEWLDAHTEVLDWAETDIQRVNLKETGRSGLTIESIVRPDFDTSETYFELTPRSDAGFRAV